MTRWRQIAVGVAAAATLSAALLLTPLRTPAATTLWSTYHLDAGRSGNDSNEPSFASLHSAWTTPGLDGAMYAEPLIDGSDVIVATENNSVYAFNAGSGAQAWHTYLGPARTSGFPCGNIRPLGITGTPVIDGGGLYVVAEVERTPSSYSFNLARINPATGAVAYNRDITPAGMNTNFQQERSALAASAGNVVIAWGGLNGDCGNYHGYLETVAESSGAVQHQWHDTANGNLGGMWAPSGPAVDTAGNIYVSTGNGSSESYNESDSVLKFSASLSLLSYFAPQDWASLNASDTDLGSTGPSLLPGGLLFAIGKGGRGYLLNQSSLPSNANGGGESYSAQVCHRTSSAAFSGLAVSGSTVLVPCIDGVAAVHIDSASMFHPVWYSSWGGSAPIVAGGLAWTVAMDGGTTLYGLDPSSGALAASLGLPATTQHFATPSAAYGRLFIAAGNRLAAFVAPNAPPVPAPTRPPTPPPPPRPNATSSPTPSPSPSPSPTATPLAPSSAIASPRPHRAHATVPRPGPGFPWPAFAVGFVFVAGAGAGGWLLLKRRRPGGDR